MIDPDVSDPQPSAAPRRDTRTTSRKVNGDFRVPLKILWPIVTLVAAIGSAWLTATIAQARTEERVSMLGQQHTAHVAQFAHPDARTELVALRRESEVRLAAMEQRLADLKEQLTELKQLLRGR